MIDNWDPHLQAEKKSAKTIRTYLEAAQALLAATGWCGAGVAVSRRSRAASRRRMPRRQGDAACSAVSYLTSSRRPRPMIIRR
jgi:hypothetical protein